MKLRSISASVSKRFSAAFLLPFLVGFNALTSQSVSAASNIPPVISAGPDQTVLEQSRVNLVAQASDKDGYITDYRWQQTKGPKVYLSESKTAAASFIAPSMLPGQSPILMVFKASARDNSGAIRSDYAKITVYPGELVDNAVPTVDAGNDQNVPVATNVELVATASDSDGAITSYRWTQTGGAIVELVNADQAKATFLCPGGQSATALNFTVTVTDDKGAQASDSVNINIESTNQDPTVNAGIDQVVFEQTEVNLSASAIDLDGQIASYAWHQTSGNSVTITNSNSANASFTAPSMADNDPIQILTFDVTAIDNQGGSATDSVSVSIQAQPAPIVSTADCTLTVNPGDSFTTAFNQLSAGDTLCLNDGVYQQIMDVPSYINVRAVNNGMAELDGMDTLGIEWQGGILTMRGTNSSVDGLRVHHAGTNADACTITGTNNTMRNTSCSHGGSHKHKIPLKISGSGHLVEDSWFFGEGRYVVQCYNGSNNIIRRNVMRWDETIANEPDEPNAAMSNYSCSDMIWENNISLDYGVPETEMKHCGDMCMSTIDNNNENYRVQYLGNMVVNHSPGTLNNRAFRADQKGTVPSSDITIKDFYVRGADSAIVFNPLYENITINNCTTIDTVSDGTLGYNQPVSCNDDADISTRYVDGVKTSEPLFPFVNEALIKRDMCASGERQSDWCFSNKSLGDYILNR